MRRHFVSGFPRALLSLSQEKSSGVEIGEVRRLTRALEGLGHAPQEVFKIERSETCFPVFLEPTNQFPGQGWSSLIFSLKSNLKNYNNKK